ncbi:MAG: rhodanese-like domain-containing protein [Myxococcota bacterium]
MKNFFGIVAKATMITVAAAVIAIVGNYLRSDGIPFLMPFPPQYRCPSLVKPGEPIDVQRALDVFGREDIVFVDARKKASFERGHIRGALNIQYSFIEPIAKENLSYLKPFSTVIAYCNHRDEELSRLMAGELSAAGIAGAVYLKGGFLEWVKSGGSYEGVPPAEKEELLE